MDNKSLYDEIFVKDNPSVLHNQVATLMNKNSELIDLHFDYAGDIKDVSNIRTDNLNLFPYSIYSVNNDVPKLLNWWLGTRCIPASREHLDRIKSKAKARSPLELSLKAQALSLSDQYWVRFEDTQKWEDVNFFTNEFSDDIGIFITEGHYPGTLSNKAPGNTTDGIMPKCWNINQGSRVLLKGCRNDTNHESYREVYASLMFSQVLKVNEYVMYSLVETPKGSSLSCCVNFVTPETEYVPFSLILSRDSIEYENLTYSYLKRMYKENYHILDWMLLMDRILLNVDRHTGNFGFIRSSITGELLHPAPIFDTGASLFHKYPLLSRPKNIDVNLKPFHGDWETSNSEIDISRYKEGLLRLKDKHEDLFHSAFQDYEIYYNEDIGIKWQELTLEVIRNNIDYLLSKC